MTPDDLDDAAIGFMEERHLATLTTLRADGTPHVVAIAFTWDPGAQIARVITRVGSQKVANVRRRGRAAVAQVDGARWVSLEGPARVTDRPDEVAEAVRRYARRYRPPSEAHDRVAIEIQVERVLGRWHV